MLFAQIVDVSDRVRSTRSRSKKIETLAALLRGLSDTDAPIAVCYLSGSPLQDRLGAGYATVYGIEVDAASAAELTLSEVDATLSLLARTAGPGSKQAKADLLSSLFGRATEVEQEFLRGLILRNLRQGALEGAMADAVAQAVGADADTVRRAAMLSGSLTTVATDALVNGPKALDAYRLAVLTPLQPMLAKTAESPAAAIASLGTAEVEWKLDGLRIQVHRDGDAVQVFTRNLNEITQRVPEIVAKALSLPLDSVILDGEALIVGGDGSPESFQDSMSRFGTDDGSRELTPFYFDILYLNGTDLIDRSTLERRAALETVVPADQIVTAIVTADADEAAAFYDEAVGAFQEGVVVKQVDARYEAGRRGGAWLKVKPAHTLDLVILAAEWGSGRRKGWLSNLHLGARDPESGYVMLGKTFKGLTDEMLVWQTERFLEIEDHRDGHVVYLEPQIVYEIAFDGVQRSPRYPGGVALRFARVKRYREDKDPDDADTIDTVRAILERRS
ncbi:MAG: ATP-dependent DNA ligase [Actinobacteria bacterium]|nr:ATP-dependent DNA ligase [Actinomycetota bacterium]